MRNIERHMTIVSLYESGLDARTIAERVQCSIGTVMIAIEDMKDDETMADRDPCFDDMTPVSMSGRPPGTDPYPGTYSGSGSLGDDDLSVEDCDEINAACDRFLKSRNLDV